MPSIRRHALVIATFLTAAVPTIAAPEGPGTARPPVAGANADAEDAKRDAAARATLERRLPELAFDGVGFSDVVDFLRDVSSANIFVNWRALETAGIDRNAPVTARLRDVRFAKAIRVVLDGVSDEKGLLDFVIDDGVITISSAVELGTKVASHAFEVRDLLTKPGDAADLPADVRTRRAATWSS